eukprot:6604659-Prorocentrum_lima.AAC.1
MIGSARTPAAAPTTGHGAPCAGTAMSRVLRRVQGPCRAALPPRAPQRATPPRSRLPGCNRLRGCNHLPAWSALRPLGQAPSTPPLQ